jgi:hypothetical protein
VEQLLLPEAVTKLPAAQASQKVLPNWLAKEPTLHKSQEVLPLPAV